MPWPHRARLCSLTVSLGQSVLRGGPLSHLAGPHPGCPATHTPRARRQPDSAVSGQTGRGGAGAERWEMGCGEDGQASRQTGGDRVSKPEEGAWKGAEQTAGGVGRWWGKPRQSSGTGWGGVGFLDREGLPGGVISARAPAGTTPVGAGPVSPEDSGWGEGEGPCPPSGLCLRPALANEASRQGY